MNEIDVDDGSQNFGRIHCHPWRDEFLIGALFDQKVLLCKPHP